MPRKSPHLTAADSAWLQMETPTNLMTITGLMMLKGRLETAVLREHFKTRLLQHDRFNMRIGRAMTGLGRHRWEPHDVDLDEHVIRIEGARAGASRISRISSVVNSAPRSTWPDRRGGSTSSRTIPRARW